MPRHSTLFMDSRIPKLNTLDIVYNSKKEVIYPGKHPLSGDPRHSYFFHGIEGRFKVKPIAYKNLRCVMW